MKNFDKGVDKDIKTENTKTEDQSTLTRRDFIAKGSMAGAAIGMATASGSIMASSSSIDLDGREGMDLPGERTAAVSSGPKSMRMPQGWRGMDMVFYEMSANDETFLEIYGYCNEQSYSTNETVKLHISTTAPTFEIEIYRDGKQKEVVYQKSEVKGKFTKTPTDAYMNGCNWPSLHEFKVKKKWRSGFYVVLLTVEKDGVKKRSEACFIVRGNKKAKIAYLITTSTWMAYNTWGGANYYWGIHGEQGDAGSPVLSFHRPWERGYVVAPPNYPYLSTIRDKLRYEKEADFSFEPATGFPFMMGYSFGANSTGWAVDNRPFAVWAEEQGYEMEYLAQTDLDRGADALEGYDLLVITGHDEYWSWDQRDTVDRFIENGGNMARFAANMLWQVRMSEDGSQQICYKVAADELDPIRNDPKNRHLLTTIWEHSQVNRPSAQTFSVTGLQGIYATYDGASPRSHGGFTVYRPDHWAFQGTNLLYGDTFGTEEGIVGYETDSVDYVIRYGLPYPSDLHSPLDDSLLLAVTPGMVDQKTNGHEGDAVMAMGTGDYYSRFYARSIEGNEEKETVDKYRYGSAQIVIAPKGKGEIFCAGTIYWFLGLKWKNRTVEQVTHNVLRRYTA